MFAAKHPSTWSSANKSTDLLPTRSLNSHSHPHCLTQMQATNKNVISITKISAYSAVTENKKRKIVQPQITDAPLAIPNTYNHSMNQTIPTKKNKQIQSEQDIKEILNSNNLFPSEIPVKTAIGKSGLMWPQGIALLHDASMLLDSYSTMGCPTDCGPQWSKTHIIAAITRGSHPTAKKPEARRYLINQTLDKVKENFAKITRWGDIKDDIPPNLKISPIAMIPHKSRDYRAILDLSFQIRVKGIRQPSVNQATNKLAPQKAMAGLGKALLRVIQTMATNYNTQSPFVFAKCDIKDGFWRMVVSEKDSWNFCYTIPPPSKHTPIENIEIVVPTSLQMGWCESPPFFCAATETGRDIIAELFKRLDQLHSHPMEHFMVNANLDTHAPPHHATDLIEVYVDDFIAGTNNLNPPHLLQLSRAILHGIHSIFPPPSISQHCGGDPISEKKMKQGDGRWEYQKEILGWILDGKSYTIFLPPDKSKKIQVLLKQVAKQQTATLHEFQQICGKLNHACIGLPSGRGLMSPFNSAMKGTSDIIQLTPSLQQALRDWVVLLQRISSRPTSVLEITGDTPWFIAYVDASKFGVGGVWINGTKHIQPTVWRYEWPADIRANLVSAANKCGPINISNLEMAGVFLAWLVLENISPICLQHSHVGIFCDNTPAVAWATRLASSNSPIGGHLCRALALRQHVHRTSPILTISIAGIKNDMADVASRATKNMPDHTNSQTFLSFFNSKFPLPQGNSWVRYHLPDKWFSRVTSCLRGTPLTMASWTKLPGQDKNIGLTGCNMQQASTKTRFSAKSPKCKNLSSSQLSLRGSGQVTTVEAVKSEFLPSLKRSQQLPRPYNWLDNKAQSMKQKGYTKSQWHGSWKDTDAKIHPPSHSLQFPSVFQTRCTKQDTQANSTSNKPKAT
jgi:hypothetical protein